MTLNKNTNQELFYPNLKGSSKRVLKDLAVQKQLTKLNATNVARRVILQVTAGQKHFEAKYNKVKAKQALIGSSASAPISSSGKNKGLIAKSYDWDEEEVSSDNNEVPKVKALMALADEERVFLAKKVPDEQIPTQKKKILRINQFTKDTSSFRLKDPVFVKSLADNSEVSITGSNKSKLSEAEDSTLLNHDTGKSVAPFPLPPIGKLTGAEHVSGPKTIKSTLKLKSTFKSKTLKGIIINEPFSAPTRGNKGSLASKTNSAPAIKLKNVKMEDDPPLDIVIKCDHAEFMSSMNINQYHTDQGESSLRSRPARPAIPFPSCIHSGYNDHKSDDCVYYPICEMCGSYNHDTYGHNMIISLRRGIKPRNPQHVTKNCKTCGSNVDTTSDHNDIEWFKKEKLFKLRKLSLSKQCNIRESLSRLNKRHLKHTLPAQIWDVPGPEGMYGNNSTYTTEGYGYGIVFKKGGKVNVP
uniref:Uncharacterized protein n=1 Tax=Tanacetum cinerariifolium TaxID=118510 RepID=A0A699GKY7_TANCI|nr:hypothetical protein [Tanacetum cinerariifolium]